MAELLLEFLSEEIPSRMQENAAEQLRRLVTKGLDEAALTYTDARAYSTPRRLVLLVSGLPTCQPDRRIERKGPRTNASEEAIQGFLRSVGLKLTQCHVQEIKGKGEFYFAAIDRKGKMTEEVLPEIVSVAVAALPWPKSMRWAASDFRWVRPLQNVLAVFDGKPVTGAIDIGGVTQPFVDSTVGHRFLGPKPFKIQNFRHYEIQLRKAKVVLDPADRRTAIWRAATTAAEAKGCMVQEDNGLLAEVAGLVEWPSVLIGTIDPTFMQVPPEVLTTSMRNHQKFFTVTSKNGVLAPYFIAVANIPASATIRSGYERVLRARLADAKYFWDQDRECTLASRTPALKDMVFHEKLGSLDNKADRIQALGVELAKSVPGADVDKVRSAAGLAKADLTTEMVGEFPELQGIMGRYYALADGEDTSVADAIAEHYSPAGPKDSCPTKAVSVVIGLSDKIDSLVGLWAIDEKPTGSRDPYALRRAAIGVIRLVLENSLRLPLQNVFRQHFKLIGEDMAKAATMSLKRVERNVADQHERVGKIQPTETNNGRDAILARELLAFFADRLKVHLRDQGVPHDHVDAVFALTGEDDLLRLIARVEALSTFLETEDGANLLTAYRRATNIVRIEERKDAAKFEPKGYDPKLAQNKEIKLWRVLKQTGKEIEPLIFEEKFSAAMATLAHMRVPVDDFFDHVTVNVEEADIRRNRLCLLADITATMNKVADFSRIEGGER